ncbi:tRNA (adenosine(37)-N6)-threonylcarbamoyltransferase complex ATPase subunit type 1 TsaE [Candidatus Peribacteria bacterium RIFCSPHIGHO2_01_FULL_51_9]|nr:MAG: tRNA (adenosine(37)-N6)-threonylcarbamoyltransferase complex ATPase subunit type 1 TsaE [Candidatus Peribacteria bacterium RIFCSPHIGHO2_01_FULL_51_9]
MDTFIENTQQMGDFVATFISGLSPSTGAATMITLSGELGAGKTTFTQAAARALGVEETVNSPTFVIEKIYALEGQKWQRLVHIDAYRLKSPDELKHLGWDEIIADPSSLVIIEWPEHVAEAIPQNAHRIRVACGEGEERTIMYDR